MWFYFVIFIFISFFCFVNIKLKQKNIVFWLIVLLLIAIAGFSGNISRDHESYISSYYLVINGKLKISDISFKIISLLVDKLFHKPLFLFIIYAILGVTLKAIAIKRLSEFWFFSILIYFSFYFFLHELTQIRAGVASAFILMSIPYIYEKNPKKFFLYAGAAAVFHFSALVLLPFYFLKRDKIHTWYFFLIPFGYLLHFLNVNLSSLIQLINIDIINYKYVLYTHNVENQKINIFNVLMISRYILCGLFLWKWKLLREKNPYSVILIKFYIIAGFIFIAFADIPGVAFRVSELLEIVEIILIPYIIYLTNIHLMGKIAVGIIGFLFLVTLLFHDKLVLGYF